jgi:hypothetical protein
LWSPGETPGHGGPSAQVTIGANLARTPNAAFGAPGNVTLPGALAFWLSLRVSEPAQLTVTLQRCARGCRTVRRLTASAPSAGAVRLRVPRVVHYRVIDAAGNRSTRTFRLRA